MGGTLYELLKEIIINQIAKRLLKLPTVDHGVDSSSDYVITIAGR